MLRGLLLWAARRLLGPLPTFDDEELAEAIREVADRLMAR